MQLEDHPTVRRMGPAAHTTAGAASLIAAAELRRLALDCGGDDAGLVEIGRSGLDPQREEILRNYPWTRTLVSFVGAHGPRAASRRPAVSRQSRIP